MAVYMMVKFLIFIEMEREYINTLMMIYIEDSGWITKRMGLPNIILVMEMVLEAH